MKITAPALLLLVAALATAAWWSFGATTTTTVTPGPADGTGASAPRPAGSERRSDGPAPRPHSTSRDAADTDPSTVDRREVPAGGVPRSRDVVLRALDEEDEKVRLAAIDVIGRRGPAAEPLIPVLEKLLTDPSARIRDRAAQALAKIRCR